MVCERCQSKGIHRVLTIVAVDEQEDGTFLPSHHKAFEMLLCLSCASDVQRMIQGRVRTEDLCERCQSNGVERVLMVEDVVDELPDGTLQTSIQDPFTMPLCLGCASDIQQMIAGR